jgi:hypothetical protein
MDEHFEVREPHIGLREQPEVLPNGGIGTHADASANDRIAG